jgi:hypothetical protein
LRYRFAARREDDASDDDPDSDYTPYCSIERVREAGEAIRILCDEGHSFSHVLTEFPVRGGGGPDS